MNPPFLDMLPMAIIGVDIHGTIRVWNTYTHQLLGWPASEATGKSFDELLFDEQGRMTQRQLIYELLLEAEHSTQPDWVLLPTLHRNGRSMTLELQVRRGEPDGPDVHGWLFLSDKREAMDEKTEWVRLHAELVNTYEALKQHNRQLDTVLANAPVILIELDCHGCFRFADGAGLQALGLSPEFLHGKPVETLYAAESSILDLHRRAMQGETFSAENQQGGNAYLSHFSPLYNTQGQVDGYTAVINDITPLKQAEAELRAAQARLAESLHAREQFLAHISHELRNPLLGILGIAEQLQQSHPGPGNTDMIQALSAQAQFMQRLVEDLLTITKLKSGAFSVKPQTFELNRSLERVAQWASIQAEHKGLSFQVTHNLHTPVHCWGDAVRMEQILLNILQNALRYTQTGGIGLQLEFHQPEGQTHGELKWTVKDTGQGFLPHGS
ncbi:MAG: PAS domain-containing sensor histidine kinase, partial [Bacteroidetes bacterium]|nr:PAS domain-containing sensor histidine kinase [Bacteroidota bacterium]